MKQKHFSGVVLILILTALALLFSSCGETTPPPAETTGSDATGTSAPEPGSGTDSAADDRTTEPVTEPVTMPETDENGYLKDNLPETLFLDRDFHIYTWSDQKGWEWYDGETYPQQAVDKVLYQRQNNVEERFGVTLIRHYENGSWEFRNSFVSTLANSVQYNEGAYDLVGSYTPAAGVGTSLNLFTDLNRVDNLDLTKPWWPSKILSTSTVGSKLYFVSGDITGTLIRNIHCMFANTDLYEQFNLSSKVGGRSVYEVVLDYDWTMETMKSLALDVVPAESDLYGLVIANAASTDSFFYGGGFVYVEDDGTRLQVSSGLASQKVNDWFDDVRSLMYGGHDDVFFNSAGSGTTAVFSGGRALFYNGSIAEAQTFAQKGLQSTIVPMPMIDADQQEYFTCANLWVTMYSIPTDAPDASLSGMILEALGSEAYRTMTDELYYNLFMIRYSATAEAGEMFDLVSDSVVFDTARPFADKIGMFASFRNGVTGDQGNWASIYASNIGTWKANLTKLLASIG